MARGDSAARWSAPGVGARMHFGAQRGALIGVYFLLLSLLVDSFRRRSSFLFTQPFVTGLVVIAGCVVGGAILLAGLPYAKSTWRAAVLGIVSAFPAMLGLSFARIGLQSAIVVAAVASALVVGSIGGIVMFQRWRREQ